MKTQTYLTSAVALVAAGILASLSINTEAGGADPVIIPEAPATDAGPSAVVFVMDDGSDPEGTSRHGIAVTSQADLTLLMDSALRSRKTVELWHEMVDEDASDAVPAQLMLAPFATRPPELVRLRGSLAAMQRQKAEWDSQSAAYLKAFTRYRSGLAQSVEAFSHGVMQKQIDTAGVFHEWLKTHPGGDYNRSDVAGTLIQAGKTLAAIPAMLRVLVINSDCEDLPRRRTPRRTPLTAQELPADIICLFVNTSRQPERQPLFRGLANPTRHAESMKAAVEMLTEWMSDPETSPASQP